MADFVTFFKSAALNIAYCHNQRTTTTTKVVTMNSVPNSPTFRVIPPKGNRKIEGTRPRDGLPETAHPLPACPHVFSSTKAERKTLSVIVG